MQARDVIQRLGLAPHPEGGHFRETFRDPRCDGSGRSVSTAIYFLLEAGEISRWHRIDAVEVWHWYAGAPLTLSVAEQLEGITQTIRLGSDIAHGELPQAVVPAAHWQRAEAGAGWTLVGCTVAPAFQFQTFELAPSRC